MRFLLVLIVAAFATTFLPENASAAEGGNHYVRTTEKIVIPWGGAVIPPGADISVRYDSGDSWITYSPSVYPKIKKSAATLEEEIIFNPTVEGIANQLTATYNRFPLNGPLLYVGVIRPNASGIVISKGESVQIGMREGDYYLIFTKKVNAGLVPVGAIDVSNIALQSGQPLHVPPVPTQETSAESSHPPPPPPHAGHLYGKLKIPYTLAGKELPAGGFVILAYDAGDSWILGGPSAHGQSISKEAVEPIERMNYFTRLAGRITEPTTVYKLMPDVVGVTKTLKQGEAFATLNPSIKVGDEVSISAREGDDYLIQFAPAGGMIKFGRVPVSTVEVTYGDPNSGSPVFVAPVPQNPVANAPERPEASGSTSHVLQFIAFAVCAAGLGWFFLARRARVGLSASSQAPSDLSAAVKARFPANRIYFVSDDVRRYLNISSTDDVPAMRENYDEWWDRMLQMYPAPPRDDGEREQREAGFWDMYAEHFKITNASGRLSLRPKQDILDFFKSWEKWVFRDYFAATGVIRKTIVEESIRLVVDVANANAIITYGSNTSVSNNEKRQAIEKAENAESNFVQITLPAHYEKWGGWFFFHIQEAFNKRNQTKPPFGPQNPTTPPNHPAQPDLSHRPIT
jgi:hypothetical protein